MNSIINEIKENLPDYEQFVIWFNQHTYTNTSLENCQRWELREALSYYFNTVNPRAVVKNIVRSVVNGTELSWTNRKLNLVDEATIQHLLRKNNIEVMISNQWPTNTKELLAITKPIDLAHRIKYKIIDRILDSYERISLKSLANYKYLLFFIVMSTIFGVWTMFVQGLLLGYILWIFLDVCRHEYFEHQYIDLKYPLIEIPFKWTMYHLSPALYHDTSLSQVHIQHHTKWKTSEDQLAERIQLEAVPGLLDYDLGFLTKPSNVTELSWPYKYYIEIKLFFLAVATVIFGPVNVFYYALLPISVIGMLQLQHDYYLIKFGEKDRPWLFLLTYNQAWHYTHHITYKKKPNSISDLFKGPSWVRYLNPQYYFVRIFFKFRT